MSYEVIVLGGGIGGLTIAALLSARGVNVCLFERDSQTGGCVANFEHLGYTFEPTTGVYEGWEQGGIYERIFTELPVPAPHVRRVSPSYIVRLPDGNDVAIGESTEQFERNLTEVFPECADAAHSFYLDLARAEVFDSPPKPLATFLVDTSPRFRSFINAQLQTLIQCSSAQCGFAEAAAVLMGPRRGVFAMIGGAQALADSLGKAIRTSGGTIRLNSPVLRLAYAADGSPVGVDLLSGERVLATRAIISNLTVWDTYGKLIGLSHTPSHVSASLKALHGWSAYLMFLAMDEAATSRLSADRILAMCHNEPGSNDESPPAQFMFAASPDWDKRAPDGKRAVTVWSWTAAEEWFAFHEDHAQHEHMDQRCLEKFWTLIHAAMPELGDGIEVIETATPQNFYERTRRKLGMVGHPFAGPANERGDSYLTIFPNVFMVGDTVSSSAGISSVSADAFALANRITGKKP